jgi:hypothetical protein
MSYDYDLTTPAVELATVAATRSVAARLHLLDHALVVGELADTLRMLTAVLCSEAVQLRDNYRDRAGVDGAELLRVTNRAAKAVNVSAGALDDAASALHRHTVRIWDSGTRLRGRYPANGVLRAAEQLHRAVSAANGIVQTQVGAAIAGAAKDHAEVLADVGRTCKELEGAVTSMAGWVEESARESGRILGDRPLTQAAPKLGDMVRAAAAPLRGARRIVTNLSGFDFDGYHVVHIVERTFAGYWADRVWGRIPRTLCGESLEGDPDEPILQPGPGVQECPRCLAIGLSGPL